MLQSIEDRVKLLIAEEQGRKRPLSWKTFKRLDKRMTGFLLVLRTDNVVKRARERLAEVGESVLERLARQGGEHAERLLRDIERLRKDLSYAKGTDWKQHEGVLKSLSGSATIKLAFGDPMASLNVTCYARTLELLVDDYQRQTLRIQSGPLMKWLARIGHPEADSLLTFDYAAECEIKRKEKTSLEQKGVRRRAQQRERTRRFREGKNWKVGLRGWLLFKNERDFMYFWNKKRSLPQTCIGLEDSEFQSELETVLDSLSCDRTLANEPDGFYYHETRRVARCRDCQAAEGRARGVRRQILRRKNVTRPDSKAL